MLKIIYWLSNIKWWCTYCFQEERRRDALESSGYFNFFFVPWFWENIFRVLNVIIVHHIFSLVWGKHFPCIECYKIVNYFSITLYISWIMYFHFWQASQNFVLIIQGPYQSHNTNLKYIFMVLHDTISCICPIYFLLLIVMWYWENVGIIVFLYSKSEILIVLCSW